MDFASLRALTAELPTESRPAADVSASDGAPEFASTVLDTF
jgi:hypothetical protein